MQINSVSFGKPVPLYRYKTLRNMIISKIIRPQIVTNDVYDVMLKRSIYTSSNTHIFVIMGDNFLTLSGNVHRSQLFLFIKIPLL